MPKNCKMWLRRVEICLCFSVAFVSEYCYPGHVCQCSHMKYSAMDEHIYDI
jgi:hypothetical protein